jgi:uncharacterized membrane protein YphA (DoxX/SURF4 family)
MRQKKRVNMEYISDFLQVITAASIFTVWILRYDNIVKEFEFFGYSALLRNVVGALKITLSLLLIVGIWFPIFALWSSVVMAILMICAQVSHIKSKNPLSKLYPSFVLLCFSVIILSIQANII